MKVEKLVEIIGSDFYTEKYGLIDLYSTELIRNII